MPKGHSLHIGVNVFDRNYYGLELSQLKAAVKDALFWQKFARKKGYTSKILTDSTATSAAVLEYLHQKSQELKAGDILLLTYSGHGSQILNEKKGVADNERYDQTWCLYDRQLIDDELYECFQAFAQGVRITVISDSCHSGTVVRDEAPMEEINLLAKLQEGLRLGLQARGFIDRGMPLDIQRKIYRSGAGKVIQETQKKFLYTNKGQHVKAAVTLLAACQDEETTFDGEEYGLFTGALKSLLNRNRKPKSAEDLIVNVRNLYSFPKPNLFTYGARIPTYKVHSPFDIDIPDLHVIEGFEPARTIQAVARSIRNPKEVNAHLKITAPPSFTPMQDDQLIILSEKLEAGKKILEIELLGTPVQEAWNAAHALQTALKEDQIETQVEPIYVQAQKTLNREGRANSDAYLPEWPPAQDQPSVKLGWHLDAKHTQLADAVQKVREKWQGSPPQIRIAHIDTGYVEGHPGLPKHLKKDEARSFIPGENPKTAIDPPDSGQDRHGTGTMILLAGDSVAPDALFGEHQGEIGGIPFAQVIPMRISENVVLFDSSRFEAAVAAAIQLNCEVITMSMAGKPSPGMSKAIDKAYQAGVVVISAASNCWYRGPGKVLPKCVLYPAAFPQVIAAVGAMYNHEPYDQKFLLPTRSKISTEYMQGCWGPASRMKYALAAYTPNVPWVGKNQDFTRGGGGTSSATPQVAAAAALWITYHRKELEAAGYYKEGQEWKKVEAVRQALFQSAAKASAFEEWQKYYGNGILRALDALQIGVPMDAELISAPKAKVSPLGAVEIVTSFFKNRKSTRAIAIQPDDTQLALELIQLLQSDPDLFDLLERLDEGENLEAVLDEQGRKRVQKSSLASNFLKGSLG